MTEERDEMREAEALDRAIDEGLAGRRPEGEARDVVLLLAEAHRPPFPKDVRRRVGERIEGLVGRRVRRVPVAVRLMAAMLGGLFLFQGMPAFFTPEGLAESLGLASEPHIFREVGILSMTLAAAAVAGALRPRLLPGVVAAVVPAGIALGVFGLFEIGHSPNPGAEVLHLVQATAAVALAVLWWRWRRRA